MELGYDRPLFILPFDQRSSFAKSIFGFKPPLTQEQTATVIASKQVVYDGFKLALSKGAPRDTVTKIEAKWLGACKPDQKPGDIVMPGGGFKLNVKDMDKLKALLPGGKQ